jgi:hypothetical protein
MKLPIKLLCTLAAAALAAPALAEDLQPPWWRGRISTTSQVWEFDEEIDPCSVLPPDGPAPGGQPPLPSTEVFWDPSICGMPPPPPWDHWMLEDRPVEYEPGQWAGYGVVPLSGRLYITVDNHDPRPENEKWIWVQLTWRPQDQGEEPIFEAIDPQPIQAPRIIEEIPLDPDPVLGWRETTYAWELDWNPPDESFTIRGTINVDELVIDTWCVPEPTSAAMLLVGLPVAIWWCRRRR